MNVSANFQWFQYMISWWNVQHSDIINVVSLNTAQARCTQYNLMW